MIFLSLLISFVFIACGTMTTGPEEVVEQYLLHLNNKEFDKAKDLLETASKLRNDSYSLESLANYYYSTGDLDNALVVYENIIGLLGSIGWESQECWVQAHLSLAKVHEDMGNTEQAIHWYQRFLAIWIDADEDLPDFIEAKSRLEALQDLDS